MLFSMIAYRYMTKLEETTKKNIFQFSIMNKDKMSSKKNLIIKVGHDNFESVYIAHP